MRTFRLDKLVRDKIVADHQAAGNVDYEVLNDDKYLEALKAKILEEAREFDVKDREKLLKELADLQEVIDCILEQIGKTETDLKTAQAEKRKKKGSFKERHYISAVTMPDDHWLTEYYSDNPKRFPEVK